MARGGTRGPNRRGRGTPEKTAAALLRLAWVAALSVLFVLAGLALAAFGCVFVVVGAEALLAPPEARTARGAAAGAFVAGLGLLGIAVAGSLVFWARPRVVSKLTGR